MGSQRKTEKAHFLTRGIRGISATETGKGISEDKNLCYKEQTKMFASKPGRRTEFVLKR